MCFFLLSYRYSVLYFQSAELKICSIDPALKEKMRKFRFRKDKTNAAIVMKIDVDAQLIVEDSNFDPEDLNVSFSSFTLIG